MKFKDYAPKSSFTVKSTYLTINTTEHPITQKVEELVFQLPGIEKDRHYGFTEPSDVRARKFYSEGTPIRNNRTWSAISSSEIERVSRNLGLTESLDDGLLGVNIVVEGHEHLSGLTQGTYIAFSPENTFEPKKAETVILVVYEQMMPCSHWGKQIGKALNKPEIESGFPIAAMPEKKDGPLYRGITGWVEKAGIVRPGYKGFILEPLGRG